jgi:predicted DCC family thiol-disulfide oxidoreductase YuxK
MCVELAARSSSALRKRGFGLLPLQTPWVRLRLGLREGERPNEMLVLTDSDAVVGGADAVVFLAKRIWWAWPLWVLGKLPFSMPLIRRGYRWVARNRNRITNTKRCTSSCATGAKDRVDEQEEE